MSISDGLMILAVLVAPFLAVWIQRKLELEREKRGRKLWVFKTLMATRGARLSLDHVQALNMIDLEFHGNSPSEKNVTRAWKEYLNHLESLSYDPEQRARQIQSWTEKSEDFLAKLLFEMARACEYDFDMVHLKRAIYSPEGHSERQREDLAIRQLVIELLLGRRNLGVSTQIQPVNEEAAEKGRQLLEAATYFFQVNSTSSSD